MKDPINLTSGEAVAKLRKLVNASSTCLFGTRLDAVPIHVCPMQVQEVDDAGDLWFFSDATSAHNQHIGVDRRVQLFFSNTSDYEFLTIYGEGSVVRDAAKTDALWDATVKAWFPGGKDDPNLTLLRIVPKDAHYWDTKNGKVVTLIQMIGAAVTGKMPDAGVHGSLSV